jgi:hypothetical protein
MYLYFPFMPTQCLRPWTDTLIVLFIIEEDAGRLAPASTFDLCISNKLYGIVTGNERANRP